MLLPVLAASDAAAAGATMRTTPLVRIGTSAIPTTASSFLACGWSRVPRAHTNDVNSPYRVQYVCVRIRLFVFVRSNDKSCTNKECSPYVSTVSEISKLGKLEESFLTILMRVKRCSLNYLLYRFPIANKRLPK